MAVYGNTSSPFGGSGGTRIVNHPAARGETSINLRNAVGMVVEAMQAEAAQRAAGPPADVLEAARKQGERDRRYNAGRLPLEIDDRVKEAMPGHIMHNVTARNAVEAVSSGTDDPVAAVESFKAVLDQIVRQLEQRGIDVSAPRSALLTEDGGAFLTEDGQPLLMEDGDPPSTEDASPQGAGAFGIDTFGVSTFGGPSGTAEPPLPAEPDLGVVEATGTASGFGDAQAISEPIYSATWTGVATRTQRLVALRDELEVAQLALCDLIEGLAEEEGNGGPLDGHDDALEALRELHQSLGRLLEAIDRGILTDELGDSLAADIARFGRRALDDLKDDPARYLVALTAFSVLTASGLGAGAGFIAGAALRLTKKKAG